MTDRIEAAERRRTFREMLEASSLGTPGAQALRKKGAGYPLTPEEEAAAAEELEQLSAEMSGWRGESD